MIAMMQQRFRRDACPALYDRGLLIATASLVILGLLMVTSSSIMISERLYQSPFYFMGKQSVFLVAGLILALITLRIPMKVWESIRGILLLTSFILLVLVLIPGIGHTVNGSTRWLGYSIFRIQISEFCKLILVLFLAGYISRHHEALKHDVFSFLKPLLVLGLSAVLLLLEPDFGAVVVLTLTFLGMLFLAGVQLWQFIVLGCVAGLGVAVLAVSSPYRVLRLTSFLDPWANQFDSGYQLTQSLIAFGRGGWLGVGLGASIQKLFYLPEAHTDFLFAVLAEELGLIGTLTVIGLFLFWVTRAFVIARRAHSDGRLFSGFVGYGFALLFGIQAMINIGVNAGLLPTKGLTLPLMSYGGSSILGHFVMVAMLLRIDYETKFSQI